MKVKLDNIDRKLLNTVQVMFPLSREPFLALGQQLGISSEEVIHRIERLKAEGIIRLTGPVFNARSIGYQTTLVAMKLTAKRLNKAAQIISTHPGVSHCYERDNDFNFWFTLAMPVEDDIESELQRLDDLIKAEATLNLPAVKIFKIGAYFNVDRDNLSLPNTDADHNSFANKELRLSSTDRAVINELQQDLPLIEKPFDIMSIHLSIDMDIFISHCQSLLQRGIMRRFSASINHQGLGFKANAMACWKVPSAMVKTTGKKIAAFQEISHCYERRTSPLWPYNLYAMMHAGTKEACESIAGKVASEPGLDKNGFVLLFSTKEVKKTRVRYPV